MNLIKAVVKEDWSLVQRFLLAGVDPNWSEDDSRTTALHFAAKINNLAIAKLLLDWGADPCLKNIPFGVTPLDTAVHSKHYEMVSLILLYIKKEAKLH